MKKTGILITILLWSFLVGGAKNLFPSGEGSFDYNMPSGEVTDTIKVFYYIPENYDRKDMSVVMGFHGNDRDCSYWIDTWKEYADKKAFMFFIPWFTREDFPVRRYQELEVKDASGNILPPDYRISALVDSLLGHVLSNSGTTDSKATIYGHSAGGQFVHRFMIVNNSPYVKKAIIGNPGWFTFPSYDEKYPYGICDLEDMDGGRLRKVVAKNVILQLAEGDTVRESFLRKTPEADRQGLNRLQRGENFFKSMERVARENHWDLNWRKVYVPEVGHDAVAMSRHAARYLLDDTVAISAPGTAGGYVKAASDWLHRYEDEIDALDRAGCTGKDSICDVLFVGSSSIRMWHDLNNAMRPLTVKNRGYGGATMRDMLVNYHRIMGGYQPKSIVMYCDNDICGWEEGDLTPEELFALYKVFVKRLHEDYPEAMVNFLSVKHSLSRKELRDKQSRFNFMMETYSSDDNMLTYVDVTTPLLKEDGDIDDSLFMDDHLHLNPKGYELWNKKVRSLLIEQCKKTR